MSLRDDVNLLYELGALRLIDRQWRRFHLKGVANLTEHHFRVAWTALIIAKHEKVKNTDKIIKMALVHDIGESRTNDVDYMARQYVDRHEDKAVKDMLSNTSIGKEFLQLWQEYEERKTMEAKIVKDADNLDVDLDLMEQGETGNKLAVLWTNQRKFVGDNKLYTDTARKLYKKIREISPHEWHIQSPHNRLNGGDWKK